MAVHGYCAPPHFGFFHQSAGKCAATAHTLGRCWFNRAGVHDGGAHECVRSHELWQLRSSSSATAPWARAAATTTTAIIAAAGGTMTAAGPRPQRCS